MYLVGLYIYCKNDTRTLRCQDEKQFDLQDGTDNDSAEEWTIYVPTAQLYGEPQNGVDTEMAINQLKSGKATGHDKIPV